MSSEKEISGILFFSPFCLRRRPVVLVAFLCTHQPCVPPTASEEPTTTESSTVEPSATEPATSEQPATSEPPTTSEPPITLEPPTTSEPPTITEEPTSTSAESATSTEPSIVPTVTDFCLKAITPDMPNRRYHIRAVSPQSNMLTEAYNLPNLARFDLDTSTGRMTMSGGVWAGYEVYTPPPFDGQTSHVLRYINGPVAYPLRCSNPDGVYAKGSVLKCEVTAPWGDGILRKYSTFTSSVSSPADAWSILLDGYVRAGAYNYDLGMFFGNDCSWRG